MTQDIIDSIIALQEQIYDLRGDFTSGGVNNILFFNEDMVAKSGAPTVAFNYHLNLTGSMVVSGGNVDLTHNIDMPTIVISDTALFRFDYDRFDYDRLSYRGGNAFANVEVI